jgi:hypothetical protein
MKMKPKMPPLPTSLYKHEDIFYMTREWNSFEGGKKWRVATRGVETEEGFPRTNRIDRCIAFYNDALCVLKME